MSEQINDGGMAFPGFEYTEGRGSLKASSPNYNEWENYSTGMTLRDWFAGQSVIAIMSSPKRINSDQALDQDQVAQMAYAIADAMIAERGKTK